MFENGTGFPRPGQTCAGALSGNGWHELRSTDGAAGEDCPANGETSWTDCFAISALRSVTTYAVTQRTREIGVRMAIGASAGAVVRLVLASALRTVGVGLCLGTVAALAGGRLIASQLYGVSARDPLTLAAIAALLAVVALAASGIPALRAARIDPMAALRAE